MPSSKKTKATTTRKAFRREVASTLQEIFTDIRDAVGKKKFSKKVSKASRILVAGAAPAKNAEHKKKSAKPAEAGAVEELTASTPVSENEKPSSDKKASRMNKKKAVRKSPKKPGKAKSREKALAE